jgi:hypothetical protein
MMDTDIRTLALLIDADTTLPRFAPALFAEITRYGAIGVRRIYTDWTIPAPDDWKECLALYAIQPVQQSADIAGSNVTYGAMIIDAMDLLHTGRFSGFCLVSSDGDFARLAIRLREQGVAVYGFGARHTPHPFVAACDRFVYLDTLPPSPADQPGEELQDAGRAPLRKLVGKHSATALSRPGKEGEANVVPIRLAKEPCQFDDPVFDQICDAVAAVADHNGRTTLAAVGTQLLKQMPNFDVRDYGYGKLSDLVEDCIFLQVERAGDLIQAITVRIVPFTMDVPIPKNYPGLADEPGATDDPELPDRRKSHDEPRLPDEQ